MTAPTLPLDTTNDAARADRVREMMRRALDAPRLTRDEIAAGLSIPRGRLESYHYGARRTPDDVRRRLAALLAGHAAELQRLAAELLAVDADDAV